MGKEDGRKSSKFLRELDEYYMARKRHNSSFSSVPCPQNFIPGATKAKMPNVKLARTVSRKVSSVCYQGVLVRMKENLTVVEKGLVPAGLLGLSFPTPSQHTSCLEHELERIRKRQSRRTIQSLSGIAEAAPSDEINEEEDASLLEAARMKQRGCSLPVTRGDVKLLPVEDPALSGLCREHKLRRSSFPLNKEEYEEYGPNVHNDENYAELDSATRLGNIFRNLAGKRSNSKDINESLMKMKEAESSNESQSKDTSMCSTSLNVMVSRKKPITRQDSVKSILVVPEMKWQREAASMLEKEKLANERKSSSETTDDEKEVNGVVLVDGRKENQDNKSKGKHMEVGKVESKSLRKSLRERFTSRRKNRKTSDEINEEQKKTFAHIQNAMRSKLPKTLQTTVRMGLSFDPMTVKERNNKARNCDTLTSMLEGRQRSKTTLDSINQMLKPRSTRSNTVANIFTTPSLIVSPPQVNGVEKQDEKPSVFDTLRRLRRRKSTNSSDNVKDSLVVPLLFSDTTATGDVSIPPMHLRKLEKLLGPEFGKCYNNSAKHRSNSLPLIRKNCIKLDPSINLDYGRSLSQLNIKQRKGIRQLFGSDALYDSDMSYESQTEAELSDYETLEDEDTGLSEEISPEKSMVEPREQEMEKNFVSEAVVFLGRKDELGNKTDTIDSKSIVENADTIVRKENGLSSKIEENIEPKEVAVESNNQSSGKSDIFLHNRSDITALSKHHNTKINGVINSRLQLKNTPDSVESRNIANKMPYRINTEFVSLKKSRTLKTTQELIAESKINREKQGLLKDKNVLEKNNGLIGKAVDAHATENAVDAHSDAIAELDALLLEMETYSKD